jgi:hypothetical protein
LLDSFICRKSTDFHRSCTSVTLPEPFILGPRCPVTQCEDGDSSSSSSQSWRGSMRRLSAMPILGGTGAMRHVSGSTRTSSLGELLLQTPMTFLWITTVARASGLRHLPVRPGNHLNSQTTSWQNYRWKRPQISGTGDLHRKGGPLRQKTPGSDGPNG